MSDYTVTTDFSTKDALSTGDPNKKIKGADVDVEFDNIATAVASKVDKTSGHTTGNLASLTSGGGIQDASVAPSDITGKIAKVSSPTAGNVATLTAGGEVQDGGLVAVGFTVSRFNDEKTAGTDGGTFTSGAWQTRTINNTLQNNISGSSISSNQITLPAGTYYLEATAPAYEVTGHQARIRDLTNSVSYNGTSEYMTAGSGSQTRSIVRRHVTFATSVTLEVQHRCGTTSSTNGFGRAANIGDPEHYTEFLAVKLD